MLRPKNTAGKGREMASPGELLSRILRQRGLTKSGFARSVRDSSGRECAYHNVYRWCRDQEFTPDNQQRAARALGLPGDFFQRPDAAEERTRETEEVLELFLRTRPVAQSLTREDLRILSSIRFSDPEPRPTVAFFESVSYALRGLIREDEVRALALKNHELERTPPEKGPPKRPKSHG